MDTEEGGWTIIQKRINGDLSFDRNWADYKSGFGAPEHNVWIGNDVIHLITKERNSSLYISITLVNGTTLYELYDQFSVSNEVESYKLFLAGNVTGSLGDGMFKTNWLPLRYNLSGMAFSTFDNDNDKNLDYDGGNCAGRHKGGWWFNFCQGAFLNGPWSSSGWMRPWHPTVKSGTNVRATIMMVKRH
ncbi:fibroleukin-like [Saccostrea cucullata]|uniref:fibroleukin-like n=1 Tax=Saccostrea cuccullata TaxID=36930 RepID=UPI002ED36812